MTIRTERLRLEEWHDRHRPDFAALHADAVAMADLGGSIDGRSSDLKFDRYVAAQTEYGISRRAVVSQNGIFLGYCGVMPRMSPDHPLGPHYEIGWRFHQAAWGKGYATESARGALADTASILGHETILSYTAVDNVRSQAVMTRLGFVREPGLDFIQFLDGGQEWRGLVWKVPGF